MKVDQTSANFTATAYPGNTFTSHSAWPNDSFHVLLYKVTAVLGQIQKEKALNATATTITDKQRE